MSASSQFVVSRLNNASVLKPGYGLLGIYIEINEPYNVHKVEIIFDSIAIGTMIGAGLSVVISPVTGIVQHHGRWLARKYDKQYGCDEPATVAEKLKKLSRCKWSEQIVADRNGHEFISGFGHLMFATSASYEQQIADACLMHGIKQPVYKRGRPGYDSFEAAISPGFR